MRLRLFFYGKTRRHSDLVRGEVVTGIVWPVDNNKLQLKGQRANSVAIDRLPLDSGEMAQGSFLWTGEF